MSMQSLSKLKYVLKRHRSLSKLSALATKYHFRFLRRRQAKLFPWDLNFELTTRCDSCCVYCPREKVIKKGIRDIGDVDFKIVKRIVQEFSTIPRYSNMIIAPVGLGEPLLYPRFFEVVKLLRRTMPYAQIHVDTNGIPMNKNICESLVDCGLDYLIISINAHDRDVYNKLAGFDKFNTVVENTRTLLQIKGNRSPSVLIQILDIDLNRPFLQRFSDFWTPLLNANDSIYFRPFDDWEDLLSMKTL